MRSKGQRSRSLATKCENPFSDHIFVKSGPIYVKPKAKNEPIANAKVSARQQCVYEGPWRRNLQQINAKNSVEKYIQWVKQVADNKGLSSFVQQLLSKNCKIPRNSRKIRTHDSSRSFKVIGLRANRKSICNFLLAINSNFGRISYRFRDTDAFCSKIDCFPIHHCLTSLAEERLAIST